MNKKIKENRYKPKARGTEAMETDSGFGIDFCLKCIMIVAAISLISLASIFAYDFVTQSAFFRVKSIEITGASRASEKEIIDLAELKTGANIFELNLFAVKDRIVSHPWVLSAEVKRDLPSGLIITLKEQQPLAIVKIENLADILINTEGQPFKEYNPQTDKIEDLPVISGLDLTARNDEYLFKGPLFNSMMKFLNMRSLSLQVHRINGDHNTGLSVRVKDIFNQEPETENSGFEIKLGFDNFQNKLKRAKKISAYIDKNYPDRVITAMDLFDIEKAFIKTKRNDALHNTIEKGV